MTSLYEISNKYQKVFDELIQNDNGTMLESSDAELNFELDCITNQIEDKAVNIAAFIKNLKIEADGVEKAISNMQKRLSLLWCKIFWLENYLKISLEKCNIKEIKKSPYFVIKIKECPLSVDIIDEKLIQDDYKNIKTTITIDKMKLKQDLLDGLHIEGATLKKNTKLEIK